MDESGAVLARATRSYPVSYPNPGWSEQNPQDWYDGMMDCLKELLDSTDRSKVAGISFGGQMHGLVILDAQDNVIRPAILWNDGRTGEETAYLNDVVGKARLTELTGNIAFAGFTAPKLMWLKKHEPQSYARIAKVMLPKDYLAYRLTGVHSSDPSDASGTLFYDVKNRCWSQEMLKICDIDPKWLPRVYESYETTGELLPDTAASLGLGKVRVAAGAGDNAAAAIGTGTVLDGKCNLSLGTSGTIFIAGDSFSVDANNALHSFAHANGRYHLMGCMLSAASCGKWWIEDVLGTSSYSAELTETAQLGENRVFFLPYLMGERSPHNDPSARAAFIGMDAASTRQQMTLAVYEGVTFALRDSFEVAKKLGLSISATTLCGGGAKSLVWRRIVANVFNVKVEIPAVEEGPGLGAAMLAAVACGEFANVEEAAKRIVKVKETILPDSELAAKYEARYQQFTKLYPALKGVFSTMS